MMNDEEAICQFMNKPQENQGSENGLKEDMPEEFNED